MRNDCPLRKTQKTTPVPQALSAPPVRKDPGPNNRRTPLPSQQQVYNQAPKGEKVGTDGKEGQAYNLTIEEAEASREMVARCGAQCPKQEP